MQLPMLSVQLTLITELKEFREWAVMFTVAVPPGGAHPLPETGGCRAKSWTANVKGTEADSGPLATSMENG